MPLFNMIIGLVFVGVFLWLIFVLVVVHRESAHPGEAILFDTGRFGHDDSISERRAQVVSNYQQTLGDSSLRIPPVSASEPKPVASNGTERGHLQKRRGEVGLFANDKVKKAAEHGDPK